MIVKNIEALSTMLNMSAGQFDLQLDNVSAMHSAVLNLYKWLQKKGTKKYST